MKKKKLDIKRQSNKQQLNDEVVTFSTFIAKNWKRYIILVLIAVLLFAISIIYYEHREGSSLKTFQMVYAAKSVKELNNVINRYPSLKVTDFDRLRLASTYLQKGEYSNALKVYNKELDVGRLKFAKQLAGLNMCYLFEAEGKRLKSAKGFDKISKNKEFPDMLRAEAAYAAGSIFYHLGLRKEAINNFRRCLEFRGKVLVWGEELPESFLRDLES